MPNSTPKIIQIIPTIGQWYARHDEVDDVTWFDPIACWGLTDAGRVVALVNAYDGTLAACDDGAVVGIETGEVSELTAEALQERRARRKRIHNHVRDLFSKQ